MDNLNYMKETKVMFQTPASDTQDGLMAGAQETASVELNSSAAAFSPLQSHSANELISLLAQQEPPQGDTAPSTSELDQLMMNFRVSGAAGAAGSAGATGFEDFDFNQQNYFAGSRSESMSSRNMWSETAAARQNDQMSTFDFLVKSVSAANNYISMLTREQMSVLQSLRPSLLYEFLQEVARARTDKRLRRALPNECAFCKNNGENEECYSTHALKDGRGRVLCPVLRAFRCPRCNATGDRAHTIKYCPDNMDNERGGGLPSRRRAPCSLLLGGSSPAAPHSPHSLPNSAPPPSPANTHSSVWSPFGLN